MKWEKEDIVEYLVDSYCLHWEKYHKYQRNDNDVDSSYESAQLDYIFNLLQTITGGSPTDVADMIDEQLEGIITFDPQDNPELLKHYLGKSFYAAQDIYYCSIRDLEGLFDEEYIDILAEEVFDINSYTNEVSIVKGTKMTLISAGADSPSGWPTFEVHGFEFDFAGDPFKLKPIN